MRLLGVRDGRQNVLGGIDNLEIEPVIPVYAPLPHIVTAAIFVGIERRVAEIVL